MQLSKNFSLKELTVTSQPFPNVPNAAQIASLRALCAHILQPLRDHLGKPITITSGYRSPRVNAAVGGSNTSDHKNGNSADCKVAGLSSRQLCEVIIALKLPFDQLIQYPGGERLHVSYRATGGRRQVLHARTRIVAGKTQTTYHPGLR